MKEKVEAVIKKLEEKNRIYTIKIIGNKENKDSGFYILMNAQAFSSTKKETFHGIIKSTLKLLDEAEIKYKIIK